MISESTYNDFKKFDPQGYPLPNSSIHGHFITKIAHSGARKNNFSMLTEDMQNMIQGCDATNARTILGSKLRTAIQPTKQIMSMSKEDLLAKSNELLGRFKQLQLSTKNSIPTSQELSTRIHSYRIERIKSIQQKATEFKLKNIVIEKFNGSSCLMIRLYPNFKNSTDTYKEGVTNVLLSFFAGMLNHYSDLESYSFCTERRQSFGFLRPTITDAGLMRLRLSLGLETSEFDNILLHCLQQFDTLLTEYNFTDMNQENVKAIFLKPGDKKRDTFVRNCVRKDNLTLRTFRQAKAYLDHAKTTSSDNYISNAMKSFLQDYVVGGKILAANTSLTGSKPIITTYQAQVADLLRNVINYGLEFSSQIEPLQQNDPLNEFSHVFWHNLKKLYNKCEKALYLLENIGKLEASHFYAKSTLLVEDILEYLISLDALIQIRNRAKKTYIDPIEKLKQTELNYAIKTLGLENIGKDEANLYFTDSGQQAITTSLLVMSGMLHGEKEGGVVSDHDVYLFNESYYEVDAFMNDVDKTFRNYNSQTAKIIFTDITQLEDLKLSDYKAMQALVIDVTHNPNVNNILLKKIVKEAHDTGKWVILVESSLKHGQAGLDKYQCGKIFTFAPTGKTLSIAARDELKAISDQGIHPMTASFLQMINCINQEKINIFINSQSDIASAKAVSHFGIFSHTTSRHERVERKESKQLTF